ncbi:hypothetical protein [Luteipulveratus mongoliensis]|uniref:Uncharacterized protein n=1 Tax=Luteipulveratus mongoliensis TaxID=571913 RepID=A0A0K1JGP3_9MICO|nr:hypothetical protein [Luteipulveratus mongoliensis]AKU15748.1 hypothetical protein VV02_07605 [Luteipulveratus mongoliensis]
MKPAPLEQALVAHLGPLLSVPVASRVPNPRPPKFVHLFRSNGSRRNLVQADPILIIRCWAADKVVDGVTVRGDADAWALVSATYDALDALQYQSSPLPLGVFVVDARLTDPVNFPDPESGTSRYQFLATLTTNLKG